LSHPKISHHTTGDYVNGLLWILATVVVGEFVHQFAGLVALADDGGRHAAPCGPSAAGLVLTAPGVEDVSFYEVDERQQRGVPVRQRDDRPERASTG
jgi:hypothetical protein